MTRKQELLTITAKTLLGFVVQVNGVKEHGEVIIDFIIDTEIPLAISLGKLWWVIR